MPIYSYYCVQCKEPVEKMVAIELRDSVKCDRCRTILRRKMDKPGMVWSPTRNNGHSF